jgi:hypothetical protein
MRDRGALPSILEPEERRVRGHCVKDQIAVLAAPPADNALLLVLSKRDRSANVEPRGAERAPRAGDGKPDRYDEHQKGDELGEVPPKAVEIRQRAGEAKSLR